MPSTMKIFYEQTLDIEKELWARNALLPRQPEGSTISHFVPRL